MPLQFAGPASSLDEEAIEKAARDIGCRVAAVRAVIDVESRGGFLADKRPKILFERHYFSRLTKRRYDRSHPAISQPDPGGYKGGRKEYDRLAQAIDLDRDAALRSASWGAFQIMGGSQHLHKRIICVLFLQWIYVFIGFTLVFTCFWLESLVLQW